MVTKQQSKIVTEYVNQLKKLRQELNHNRVIKTNILKIFSKGLH